MDFGGEPEVPPPSAAGAHEAAGQRESQYMTAAGVGVRVKSLKRAPHPQVPQAAENGELFPPAQAAEETTPPPREETPPPAAGTPQATAQPIEEKAQPAAPVPAAGEPALTTAEEKAPVHGKTAVPRTSGRGRKSLRQVAAEADLIEIPADEVLFAKQYYTMGEVAEMFKVNQSLLRYWETEFDILQPRKNKKGDRYFRPVDIKNLHLIYHLLRQKKYTIEGAKEFLRNNKKAKDRFEVIERLRQIRNFLLEWKAQL